MNIYILILNLLVFTYANTYMQVIHNSASPTVDVYIDGNLSVEDFMYRTATPVLELGTSFTVGIAPADGDIIAEFPFELMDGGEYVVVATGLLGNNDTPFNLAATATIFGADEGNVGLEVYHGSTDAPAVDVLANGSVLLPNLTYGEFSGYNQVPAADYTIGIAPTGGESIADFVAPLSGLGGGSAVVFASGFLSGDEPAFGLFAALNDGTVLELGASLEIEEIVQYLTSFKLTEIYPNPFNPSTNINYIVEKSSRLNIDLFNLKGEKIKTLFSGVRNIGKYSLNVNLDNLPSGQYLIKLANQNNVEIRKVTLLK